MSEMKLLPCPFCGSKAELCSGSAGAFVICPNTDCDIGQASHNWTEEAAVGMWNTRDNSELKSLELKFDELVIHNTALEHDLKQLQSQLASSEMKVVEMRQTIGFFASVIKCGEPWTEQCQVAYNKSLSPDSGKRFVEVEKAEHMLETLHMAYQFTLDEIQPADVTKRLTLEQGKELGRRLAQYWDVKSLTTHQPTTTPASRGEGK